MKRILLILLLTLIRYSEAMTIRVGIINGKEPVNISATGYMDIINLSTNEVISTTYGWRNDLISATKDGLTVRNIGTFMN